MHRLSLVLTLFAPLALACEGKDDGTAGSSGGTSDGNSGGNSGGATEVSGATDNSPGSDSAATGSTGDDLPTTANSVTTPPMTEPTGPSGDPTQTGGDPTETTATVTSANPTDPTGADPDEDATQLCVDTINMYRATLGLAPLQRWGEQEDCTDAECLSDGMSGVPHGAFGMCGESAQNECPGWGGPPNEMITGCLELMWNEGPGEDFSMHGHYINMSNPDFTRVACGFAEVNGQIWAIQNFN